MRGRHARRRGRLGWYAVAFLLVVASAVVLFYGNRESSLTLIWTSIGLSGLAIVVGVASVFGPAR